jgi:glycopeptide antibiotics resistance protein
LLLLQQFLVLVLVDPGSCFLRLLGKSFCFALCFALCFECLLQSFDIVFAFGSFDIEDVVAVLLGIKCLLCFFQFARSCTSVTWNPSHAVSVPLNSGLTEEYALIF